MIKITDNIFINADERQYILQKEIGIDKKTGKTKYKNLGYYQCVSDAIRACSTLLLRQEIQNTDLTLKEAYHRFNEVEQRIKQMLPENI